VRNLRQSDGKRSSTMPERNSNPLLLPAVVIVACAITLTGTTLVGAPKSLAASTDFTPIIGGGTQLQPASALHPSIVPPWPWALTTPIELVAHFRWASNGTELENYDGPGQYAPRYGPPATGTDGLVRVALTVDQLTASPGSLPSLHLVLNPNATSSGTVTQQRAGSKVFNSAFDVFFDVFVDTPTGILSLHNSEGLNLSGTGTVHEGGAVVPGAIAGSNGTPVAFVDPAGAPVLLLTGFYLIFGLVPCLQFSESGLPSGAPVCNLKANDIEVDYQPSAAVPCAVQFTLNGGAAGAQEQCPSTANDLEAKWGTSPAALPFLTGCTWTLNGAPMPTACQLPSGSPVNGFALATGNVTGVTWSHNGRAMKPVFTAPPGANGVDFFRYSSGYAAGNDTFFGEAVLNLQTGTGAPLPPVVLSGPATIVRGNATTLANGITELPTQVLSLDLSGALPQGPPLTLTLDPGKLSIGYTMQQKPGIDFPAQSFFDVFFDVQVGGPSPVLLHNALADNMSATLTAIPPSPGTTFQSGPGTPIPLLDGNGSAPYSLVSSYFVVGLLPCLAFTVEGAGAGGPVCNAGANDLTVDYAQASGTNCTLEFNSYGSNVGLPTGCPTTANDVEFVWNSTSLGMQIAGCSWTHGGRPLLKSPCDVPTGAPANGFSFSASKVTRAIWTLNGRPIKPAAAAPPGANGLTFFDTAGYPPAGTDAFSGTEVLELQGPGGPLPPIVLTGRLTLQRGTAHVNPDGLVDVPTQLTNLALSGNSSVGPVQLSLDSQLPSNGQITQLTAAGAFPASSFFDVFLDLTLPSSSPSGPPVQLVNSAQSGNISATVNSLPATPGTMYSSVLPIPFQYANESPSPYVVLHSYLILGGAASVLSFAPCFLFLNNSTPLGSPTCNSYASDIGVNFDLYGITGGPCGVQFTYYGASDGAPVSCPEPGGSPTTGFDAEWPATGGNSTLYGCYWYNGGVKGQYLPCSVPSAPSANGFTFYSSGLYNAYFTYNGGTYPSWWPGPYQELAPAGANELEGFF